MGQTYRGFARESKLGLYGKKKGQKRQSLSRDFVRESKLGLYERQKGQKKAKPYRGLRPREQAWIV